MAEEKIYMNAKGSSIRFTTPKPVHNEIYNRIVSMPEVSQLCSCRSRSRAWWAQFVA